MNYTEFSDEDHNLLSLIEQNYKKAPPIAWTKLNKDNHFLYSHTSGSTENNISFLPYRVVVYDIKNKKEHFLIPDYSRITFD